DDASGDRLRSWLVVDRASFYDRGRFAIVPMGFCFPGYDYKGAVENRPLVRMIAHVARPLESSGPEACLLSPRLGLLFAITTIGNGH
ncbi:hypothetical protein ACC717_37400, partial [Rhizobium ruizarguesonis]